MIGVLTATLALFQLYPGVSSSTSSNSIPKSEHEFSFIWKI